MIKKILYLAFIFNSCSPSFVISNQIKDSSNYDKNINFTFYKSFSFNDKKAENTFEVSQLDINQIKDEIRSHLKNKHILEVEKNPAMFIEVHSYVRQVAAAQNNGFGSINTYLVDYLFVVLDIKDAKTDRFIWRGEAKSPLPNNFMQKKIAPREKIISAMIKKVLEKFPPSYLEKKKD